MTYCVVLITAPSVDEGKKIARGLVEKKLAACVNLVPHVESVYWWENKMEESQEVLLIVKTKQTKLEEMEAWVKAHHSYTVPELIALPIAAGSSLYLHWLDESVT